MNPAEPDFSICGQPLLELLGFDHLDEHIEQVAVLALMNPKVAIAVCRWLDEGTLNEFRTWLVHQRALLAAWRTSQADRGGTLKLRSRTVARPGEQSAVIAFVIFHPARRAARTRTTEQVQ